MKPWRSIFALVPDCHTSVGHYRSLWQRHFYAGIRAVVDQLAVPQGVNFDWARYPSAVDPERSESLRAATSEAVREQIRGALDRAGVDVVISYCFSGDLDLELVNAVVARGVPWINFFCDSTHRFGEVSELASAVSLNWFPESSATPKYAALGAPWACLPYALNPDHLPDCSATSSRRAAFIGLPSTNRITQLGILGLLGVPVEIRGHGWIGAQDDPFHSPAPRLNRAVRALSQRGAAEKILRRVLWPLVRRRACGALGDDEFFSYLRGCGVVLGLNQGRDELGRLDSYLKFRDLEFPGYGCCYLTQLNEDVAKVFEVGVEVATFDSLPHAARQIRELLSDPERSRRIGSAGRARVLAEHNWRVRLSQLAGRL